MKNEQFLKIPLKEIQVNPLNPRQRFDGPKFEAFQENISQVGILQPILCRPIKSTKFNYEVVFGGRRFQAKSNLAKKNGDPATATILARVKELTDAEAFDLMTVENLQRDDLTPLEEANTFQLFVKNHGHGGVAELARRININERYIRRRLSVLDLPKPMLNSWNKGEVKFSHLEQITRLKEKDDRTELFNSIVVHDRNTKDIRRAIENNAPSLKKAKFNLKAANCLTCSYNGDVQAETLGHEGAKGLCHSPKCYKQNTNNHFLKYWKQTALHQKHKTTGFRFSGDIEYYSWNSFYSSGKPKAKCFKCDNFVSIIHLDGTPVAGAVCIGEKACHDKITKNKPIIKSDSKAAPAPDTPRVPWHGEHFREVFFKERIPEKLTEVDQGDDKFQQLILFSLVRNYKCIHVWYATRHELEKRKSILDEWYYLAGDTLLKNVLAMDPETVKKEIHAVTVQIVISKDVYASTRRTISEHIGIDLASEWTFTDEYLQKKTKGEMMGFGKDMGIFKDPKAETFLFEKLIKKRRKYNTCRKPELIRVFLESGVDLKGKVPAEILAK